MVQIHPPQPTFSPLHQAVGTGLLNFNGGFIATSAHPLPLLDIALLNTRLVPARAPWQHAPHHHAVRGTLALRHGSGIDIHCALDAGVPEQLLLDPDVNTHPTQRTGVGMPKGVPANLADAGPQGCGLQLSSQNALLPAGFPARLANTQSDGF